MVITQAVPLVPPQPSVTSSVTELMLHRYRNYPDLHLSLHPGSIVITGRNGMGKTNILEAISLLSPGRGLRGAKLSQLTHLPSVQADPRATWALSAQVSTPTGDVMLGTGLDFTATGSERRLVKIQGSPAKSQAELTQWINILWMTPEQDRLFMESAGTRRKFIDRMVYVLDPEHASRTHRYEHHVRERSTLLQQDRFDPHWIKSLETRIAEDGVAIAAARADLMHRLVASQIANPDYPFPRFSGQMAGIVESWLEDRPALAAEDELAAQLSQLRLQDRQTGGAGIGPHRSDLKIQHVRKNLPADLCSTGEQKMLVLALVLAFAKIQLHHREGLTVVLLDDVVAHLDDHHRRVMFQEICSGKANPNLQVWMTGADYRAFADLEHQAQFLTLKNDG